MKLATQDLVHPPDRLEAVQVVLGRLASRCAPTRWPAARSPGGFARPRASSTRVTGCWASQSISRSGCSLRSSLGDRDVAPRVAEPDRRGDVERALGAGWRPRPGRRSAPAPRRRVDEVAQEQVDLHRVADVRAWPAPSSVTSAPPVASASAAPARCGLDRVAVAVDHEHRAAHARAQLADVVVASASAGRHLRRRRSASPASSRAPSRRVLDLLGRVRLGEHCAKKNSRKPR